jgi:5-methylcytosine-specific restriction enzyme A
MWQPKRICATPGCGVLSDGTRCEAHAKLQHQRDRQRRGNAADRGYDGRWQRLRDAFIASHPLCQRCQDVHHRVRAAEMVHHLDAISQGNPALCDESRLMALCNECHAQVEHE